jgi:hypothetical protein
VTNDMIDHVRRLAPAAAVSELDRTRQRRKLDETIAARTKQSGDGGVPAHRKRRLRGWVPVSAAVVSLAVMGGGIAAAVTLLGPTPQQAKKIYQHYYPNNGAGHIPGTRPTLNSELVLCDYRDDPSVTDPELLPMGNSGNPAFFEAFASSDPLTKPLTAQMLISTCVNAPTSTRDTAIPASVPATLCVTGQATTANLGDWPVVVFGNTTCTAAGDGPAPSDLLDQVNQRRSAEATINAVPESCPTESQAVSWVKEQLANLQLDYPLQLTDGGPGGRCYLPYVQWGSFAGTSANPESPFVEVGASQQLPTAPSGGEGTTTTTLAPNSSS